MKKWLISILALVMVLGGGVALTSQTQAASKFAGGDVVTLAKGKVHNGSIYASGKELTINGTINGDLYCAGQDVVINGTVNGDVLCAAQTIKINGTVAHDVRVAGQFVTVTGTVHGSVSSFAQSVDIAKGASVDNDLNGAAQTITLNGTIGRDMVIGSEKLTMKTGKVAGDARVDLTTLDLSTPSTIGGSFEYSSQQKQPLTAGIVGGKVIFDKTSPQKGSSSSDMVAALVRTFLLIAIAMIIMALVVALIAPRYLERSNSLVRKKPGQVALVGIALTLGGPILGLFLALTGLGLPLALLVFAGLFVLTLLSFPFGAYYLARALFGQVINNVLLLMVAGAALIAILMAIPILNILVYCVVAIFGVGGLASTIVDGYRKPNYRIS